jgi:hypothetical protein
MRKYLFMLIFFFLWHPAGHILLSFDSTKFSWDTDGTRQGSSIIYVTRNNKTNIGQEDLYAQFDTAGGWVLFCEDKMTIPYLNSPLVVR